MKNFNYTGRDASGALKRGTIQSADRVSALRELKAQGIVPMSVTEGGPLVKAARLKFEPRTLMLVVFFMAGVSVTVFVYVYLTPKTSATTKAPQKSADVVHKVIPPSQKPPNNVEIVPLSKVQTQEVVTLPQPVDPVMPQMQEVVVPAPKKVTEALAREVPKGPIRGAQKRLVEAFEKGLPTEPLFKHECESILAFYVRPGEPPSPYPLPKNIEEQARAALAEDIVVTSEDTPEQVQEKEMVAWMKDDMRKYLASGGTAQEYFALMQERQEKEAALFLEARKILGEYNRKGNTEETLTAYRELNKALKAEGIAPMPLPGKLRKVAK